MSFPRIDRIVRPAEAEIMEREVFAEALFAERTPPWVKLVKMYLIYQNGEACISCPLVCTEGLVAALEKFADTPELHRILAHCKEGIDGHFGIGAQYISEVQGGSDIPSKLNTVPRCHLPCPLVFPASAQPVLPSLHQIQP